MEDCNCLECSYHKSEMKLYDDMIDLCGIAREGGDSMMESLKRLGKELEEQSKYWDDYLEESKRENKIRKQKRDEFAKNQKKNVMN